MTTVRRFSCFDLLRFNEVNLDNLTETYHLPFYQQYMALWPEYCQVVQGAGGKIMGYILGKVEGEGRTWHGHVTAVTVGPNYRRMGLARRLMDMLEDVTEKVHNAYYVDLFVRASNQVAITMYERLGYQIYRRVLGYYSGQEDAFDMRKSMARDKDKRAMIPLKRPVKPEELEFD
eukprot:TRINITY_DN5050_c0_g1_i5.p2 TRINITY_DN5050_c0_g1~~TRINITY_DN5050_c0_g1_i5.p2  ORF type:complete len:195 (-),score=11.92 TRINITY_DN5050_c0_g1_i5:149-673(-)